MRRDHPHGFWYFRMPHAYGTVYAGILLHRPLLELLKVSLILFFGTWMLRGATCTWNYSVDARFDRKVARYRAIVGGAVSTLAANLSTFVQSFLTTNFLLLLSSRCVVYAVPSTIWWIAYPLAKCITTYPQLVLGFPMSMGVLMGAVALGAEPLPGAGDLDPHAKRSAYLLLVGRNHCMDAWLRNLLQSSRSSRRCQSQIW